MNTRTNLDKRKKVVLAELAERQDRCYFGSVCAGSHELEDGAFQEAQDNEKAKQGLREELATIDQRLGQATLALPGKAFEDISVDRWQEWRANASDSRNWPFGRPAGASVEEEGWVRKDAEEFLRQRGFQVCGECSGLGEILGQYGTVSDLKAVEGSLLPNPPCEKCKGQGRIPIPVPV